MRRPICVGLTPRTDLVCEAMEISGTTTTDVMALIMTELPNYDPSSEIKERKLQRSYFQDNVPQRVLANENKYEEMKRISDVETGLFLNMNAFQHFL